MVLLIKFSWYKNCYAKDCCAKRRNKNKIQIQVKRMKPINCRPKKMVLLIKDTHSARELISNYLVIKSEEKEIKV